MAEEKDKGGRPTKYKEGFVEQARVACAELGATDVKLAKLFGIGKSTLNEWKLAHPEFLAALKEGKADWDDDVVKKALFKQAVGYRVKEKTTEDIVFEGVIVKDEKNKNKNAKKIKVTTKYFISSTATIFWLKNRKPGEWRDIKAVEVSGPGGKPIETKNATITGEMTPKEAAFLYAGMVKNGD